MLRRYRLLLIPIALLVGWLIRYFVADKSVSLQTATFVLGGLVMLTLVGVAFGIRTAKASEARRKAQEDIFLNH